MWYHFLTQKSPVIGENIVFKCFISKIYSFGIQKMYGYRVGYEVCNLQSYDIIFLCLKVEFTYATNYIKIQIK